MSINLPELCDQLMWLNRQRERVLNRERLINLPGEQHFRSEIAYHRKLAGDDSFEKKNAKQQYAVATKLRNLSLKVVNFDEASVVALMLECPWEWADTTLAEFAALLRSHDSGLSDEDVRIVASLLSTIQSDKDALRQVTAIRANLESVIEDIAQELPVCEWWSSIIGCGAGGLGKLIGATGNLDNYRPEEPGYVGRIWRRLGLAPYEKDGVSKAGSTWKFGGLKSEDWEEFGYCPKRRSVVFTLGDPVIKHAAKGGVYGDVLKAERRRQYDKAVDAGKLPVTTQKSTQDNWREKYGLELMLVKQFDKHAHMQASHIQMRARRYMEKRLVKDLALHWAKCSGRSLAPHPYAKMQEV